MTSSLTNGISGLASLRPFAHLAADPNVEIVRRPVDHEWLYRGAIPHGAAGFNPFTRKVFVADRSAMGAWLDDGCANDRAHNEGDALTREVLFAGHDYLHAWSCLAIQNLAPEIGYGSSPITPETFEGHVFCHLLTETAATVGLDYWYLSTFDLDEAVGVGTAMRNLTVRFRDSDLRECRRIDPAFAVLDPEFFGRIAGFYASGIFPGIALDDLRESQTIRKWLEHELTYGAAQRRYTREWFAYLSNGRVKFDPGEDLDRPVGIPIGWGRSLTARLGEMLWEKMREDRVHPLAALGENRTRWRREAGAPIDFRFTNLRSLSEGELRAAMKTLSRDGTQFSAFYSQWLSAHDHSSFPSGARRLLRYARAKRDPGSVRFLFDRLGVPKLRFERPEEPDLFFPG